MNRHASKVSGMSDDEIAALIKRLNREIPDAQALRAQAIRTQKHRIRRRKSFEAVAAQAAKAMPDES